MKNPETFREWLALICVSAGVASLGVWAWAYGHEAIYQSYSNWAFDRAKSGRSASAMDYAADQSRASWNSVENWFRRAPAPPPRNEPKTNIEPAVPASPRQIERNGMVGRLSIPRLNVRSVIREGVGQQTLSIALGHVPGTALPGEAGNVAVAGHRDTLFRGLRNVKAGDRIEFETANGKTFVYEVQDTSIVNPTDVGVLKAGPRKELTLVTCYPFNYVGSAPYRFIVKAREIDGDKPPEASRAMAAVSVPAVRRPLTHLRRKPVAYDYTLANNVAATRRIRAATTWPTAQPYYLPDRK